MLYLQANPSFRHRESLVLNIKEDITNIPLRNLQGRSEIFPRNTSYIDFYERANTFFIDDTINHNDDLFHYWKISLKSKNYVIVYFPINIVLLLSMIFNCIII